MNQISYYGMNFLSSIRWYEIYEFILAFLLIGVVVLAVVMTKTILKGDKQYTGFMKFVADFFSLNGTYFENLVKLLYIVYTAYYVLSLPLCFTGGFFTGFYNMIHTIIFNIGGSRVVFEGLMLLYRTYKKVNALGDKMGIVDETPAPVVAQTAPVVAPAPQPVVAPAPIPEPVPAPAPIPEPVPAPAPIPEPVPAPAPIPEPVPAPAPIPEPVPAPAPIPEPVPAPAPIPEPVPAPAPIPEPVPAPAPIPEPVAAPIDLAKPNACISCAKEIKAGAKFCPFCGTPQQ